MPDLAIPYKSASPLEGEVGAKRREGGNRAARAAGKARKPNLDEMGPGPDKESKPYRPGPRSTTGRPGMRGGWRPRGR